jgi:hypothetical protein
MTSRSRHFLKRHFDLRVWSDDAVLTNLSAILRRDGNSDRICLDVQTDVMNQAARAPHMLIGRHTPITREQPRLNTLHFLLSHTVGAVLDRQVVNIRE